jgi:hypothetical protein
MLRKKRAAFVPMLRPGTADIGNVRFVYNRLANATIRQQSVANVVREVVTEGAPTRAPPPPPGTEPLLWNPLEELAPSNLAGNHVPRIPGFLKLDYASISQKADAEYVAQWLPARSKSVRWDDRLWDAAVNVEPYRLLRQSARRGSWVAMLWYLTKVTDVSKPRTPARLGLLDEAMATYNLCAGNAQLVDTGQPSEAAWYAILHRITGIEGDQVRPARLLAS